MLVRNLDQPTRRVGADPSQRAAVSSMEQAVGQSGRNASNCGYVLECERAACHQVAQLGSKWPCIHPVIANLNPFGEHRHSNVPSSKPSTWRRPLEGAGC